MKVSHPLSADELVLRLQKEVPQIEPVELLRAPWREQALVFDIRDPQDAADGSLPGARLVGQRFIELEVGRHCSDVERPIVVSCYGGRTSLLAASALLGMGYRCVYSLRGGFTGWKDAGLPVERPLVLKAAERLRYSRHLSLPQVGESGQLKLKAARVALVGAGGLGSPIALYLAAAGVGYIRLIDPDSVEDSNLQRQVIHGTSTVGLPKVESARQRMLDLNPYIDVDARTDRLDEDNAAQLLGGVDVIVDGSDNFDTRYAVNAAAIAMETTLVSASIFQFSGQVAVFAPHLDQPCYACLYPERTPNELAPSCSSAGVIGALAGVVGLMQAMETVKLILGLGEPLMGKLLVYDGLKSSVRTLKFNRAHDCPDCGQHRRSAAQRQALQSATCALGA